MGFKEDLRLPIGQVIKRDIKKGVGKVKEGLRSWKVRRAERLQERAELNAKVRAAEDRAYWVEKEKLAVVRGKERARTSWLDRLSKGFKQVSKTKNVTKKSERSIKKVRKKDKKSKTKKKVHSRRSGGYRRDRELSPLESFIRNI